MKEEKGTCPAWAAPGKLECIKSTPWRSAEGTHLICIPGLCILSARVLHLLRSFRLTERCSVVVITLMLRC